MHNEAFSYSSPLGTIAYHWDGTVCNRVELASAPSAATHRDPVSEWLDAYFAGRSAPLPPMADARTPFQARLRTVLLAIPLGSTRSYAELAAMLGTGPRALGQGVGANPLPLLIPCHRVVAANGGLGGFSGGLEWKRRLLAFERKAA